MIAAVAAFNVTVGFSAKSESGISLKEVEALAACESIGWWNNDGNCVSNDGGSYFCKSDSGSSLTDCKQ